MCISHQILDISLCLNEVISCISGNVVNYFTQWLHHVNVNFSVMLHRCDEVCD